MWVAAGCAGWVEPDELAAPEASIDAPAGYAVVPSASPQPPSTTPIPEPPPRCETTMRYMESEDGTTPRQRAMFAPGMERRPWPEIRAWFHAADVALPEHADIYAYGGNDLGRALDDPSGNYDCPRIVEIAGREAAVCTRSAIVEHAVVQDREVLEVDWMLIVAERDGLVPVEIGPQVDSGSGFDTALEPPLDLLPYVRLDLVIVDAQRGRFRLEEAAPGVCEYACAHAQEVERRNVHRDPLAARETLEVAATCDAIGTYTVSWDKRGAHVVRTRRAAVGRLTGRTPTHR